MAKYMLKEREYVKAFKVPCMPMYKKKYVIPKWLKKHIGADVDKRFRYGVVDACRDYIYDKITKRNLVDGEYIVKHSDGTLQVCEKEYFEKLYEPVKKER